MGISQVSRAAQRICPGPYSAAPGCSEPGQQAGGGAAQTTRQGDPAGAVCTDTPFSAPLTQHSETPWSQAHDFHTLILMAP